MSSKRSAAAPEPDAVPLFAALGDATRQDRKSTRLNSSHVAISYAVFCLNARSPPELYTLSLHDALPISIVESGFDRIPLTRRAEAFRMNDNGWAGQIKHLARYVE